MNSGRIEPSPIESGEVLPLPFTGEVGDAKRLRVREFVEAWASPHPVSLREPDLSRQAGEAT